MKRSIELEFDVQEIVKIGKTRDKEGKFLYPVMAEPAVMAFFGAADALYEVITQRPILLLNLLQVNKALGVFWNQFTGNMWIKMIDMIIENEMGKYASEIYPFIAVHKERRIRRLYGERKTLVEPFVGPGEFEIRYITSISTPVNPIFYVVYYDPLTQLYITLMEKIMHLRDRNTHVVYTQAIRRYLFMSDFSPKRYVAIYSDCFLVAAPSTDTAHPFTYSYNVEAMREDLSAITDTLIGQPGRFLEEAQKLIVKITTLLDEGVRPGKPVLIKLDKNIAAPYRVLLYDSEQGLVKTREEQRAFLVELLNALNVDQEKDLLVEKYGQPFSCTMCQCETQLVDPVLMRAFCTERCVSQYNACK